MSCVEMVSYTRTFTLAGWREFAFEMTAAAPTRRTRRGVSEGIGQAGEWGWTMGIFTLNVEFCTFLVHIFSSPWGPNITPSGFFTKISCAMEITPKKSRPSHTGWFGLVWCFAAGTTVTLECQHLFLIFFYLVWCSNLQMQ